VFTVVDGMLPTRQPRDALSLLQGNSTEVAGNAVKMNVPDRGARDVGLIFDRAD
jgi:hypothetical protein|tara:strand:- start:380 stop:541 length:162 start_codon:yes stop_codon:yes gene_type:complete